MTNAMDCSPRTEDFACTDEDSYEMCFPRKNSIETAVRDYVTKCWHSGSMLSHVKAVMARHPCPNIPIFDFTVLKNATTARHQDPNLLVVYLAIHSALGPLVTLLEHFTHSDPDILELKPIVWECVGDAVTLTRNVMDLLLKMWRLQEPGEGGSCVTLATLPTIGVGEEVEMMGEEKDIAYIDNSESFDAQMAAFTTELQSITGVDSEQSTTSTLPASKTDLHITQRAVIDHDYYMVPTNSAVSTCSADDKVHGDSFCSDQFPSSTLFAVEGSQDAGAANTDHLASVQLQPPEASAVIVSDVLDGIPNCHEVHCVQSKTSESCGQPVVSSRSISNQKKLNVKPATSTKLPPNSKMSLVIWNRSANDTIAVSLPPKVSRVELSKQMEAELRKCKTKMVKSDNSVEQLSSKPSSDPEKRNGNPELSRGHDEDNEDSDIANMVLFRCQECGENFKSIYILQEHIITAHSSNKERYKCLECNAAFAVKSEVQTHYREEHACPAKQTYRCYECVDSERYPSKRQLLLHVKTAHTTNRLTCGECNRKFGSKSKLLFHRAREHNVEKRHTCKDCGKAFFYKADLRKHSRSHKPVDKTHSQACDECGEQFASRKQLKTHRRTHKGEEVHKCPSCPQQFPFESVLRKHVNSCHGGVIESKYSCETCLTTFMYKADLRMHNSSDHPEKKTYRCVVCQRKFPSKAELRRHAQAAHGRIPLKCQKCPYCPSAFSFKSALDKHVRTHTGERPFKCQECDAAFTQSNQVQLHFRTHHSKERPYACDECSETYPTGSQLKSHKISQHGLKSHTCEICGFAFTLPYQLKAHLRVHTKERPYKCETCGKAFSTRCNMLNHIRIKHTGERPYQCEDCSDTFASSAQLRRHLHEHFS